jgi:antitoxin component of MazEF toxin-antitoxin module
MKTFTSKVLEICDNGDAIIELPPELMEELGWQIGDKLNMDLIAGAAIIENIDNNNRKKSLDKPV